MHRKVDKQYMPSEEQSFKYVLSCTFFVGVDRGKNCNVIRFCHDINNVQVLLDYRENSWN